MTTLWRYNSEPYMTPAGDFPTRAYYCGHALPELEPRFLGAIHDLNGGEPYIVVSDIKTGGTVVVVNFSRKDDDSIETALTQVMLAAGV